MTKAWLACVVAAALGTLAGCGGELAGGSGDEDGGDGAATDGEIDVTFVTDGDSDGASGDDSAREDSPAHDGSRKDADRHDASGDAPGDAGFDAGPDAEFDGGHDAGFDGGHDAGFDGSHDAGFDGGHDAGFDGGHDASFDGGHDAGFDGGHDAGSDASCTPACDPELGLSCVGGVCTGDCADLPASSVGCEYYAVTMTNDQLPQTTFGFYVVAINESASSATLTITGGALASTDTVVVAAGDMKEILLPWVSALSMSQATTISTGGAYHIKSTEPITAYQFNGLEAEIGGTESATNDGSLLLPVATLTGNYYVAAWPSWSDGTNFAGTIAIVGTAASTTVTITPPSAAFQAGAGLTSSGGTVTLNAGDVLQIGTVLNAKSSKYGTDPSGTVVTATSPVEVFGGSDCTNIPANVGYCDHLEEVQFPVETLGTDYLVTLPDNTNGKPPTPAQFVKIVGTVDGTTLTYDPPTGYVTAPATTLDAGEVTFFQTMQNFHVTATSPIVVAQFMESGTNFGTTDTSGDPSMSMAVPTSQFQESYGFIAPATWVQDWVNVIAPTGASVTVTDYPTDQTVSSGTAIGASGYYLAYVQVCDNSLKGCTGYHTASSSSPFGIQIYTYASSTSLMYPGSLNLTP